MQISIIKPLLIKPFICVFLLLASFYSAAQLETALEKKQINADVLWHESHGSQRIIYISLYREEEWSQPLEIYRTDAFVSSTAISTLADGRKIAFWSEDKGKKTKLFFTVQRQLNDLTDWQQPQLLPFACRECLAASPVLDLAGNLWLFWTDNGDGDDNVYTSRYQLGQWSAPEQVNESNTTPDILPVANINEFGQVEVQWQTYSVLIKSYTQAVKAYGQPLKESETALGIDKDISLDEIPFSPSVPYNVVRFMHVQNNKRMPNLPITN